MGEVIAGRYTYGLPIARRGNCNTITIGAFCSIAGGVCFDSGFQHNMKYISTFPFHNNFPNSGNLDSNVVCKGDIVVGNDVWIGEQSMIMGNVTIGDGAVIGFRSIISKDVPPYAIVAGAPQKLIRYRFNEEDIALLLQMKWWDWTDEQIKQAGHLLMSENIMGLYEYYFKNIAS